jgi:hypothetical protein
MAEALIFWSKICGIGIDGNPAFNTSAVVPKPKWWTTNSTWLSNQLYGICFAKKIFSGIVFFLF